MALADLEEKTYYNERSISEYREICQRKRMTQSGESLIGRFLYRHLSIYVTLFFHKVGVRSPNTLTVLSIIPGAASGYLFWSQNWLFAGLAFQIFVFLDACDGEMARLTGKTSRFGLMLDELGHLLIDPSMMGGFYLGLWTLTGAQIFIFLGVAAALLKMWDFTLYLLSVYVKSKSKLSKHEHTLRKRPLGPFRVVGYLFNLTMLSLISILVGLFEFVGFEQATMLLPYYGYILMPGLGFWVFLRHFYSRAWLDEDVSTKL